MNRTLLQAVVRHAEALAAETSAGVSDDQLLDRFIRHKDQAAFAGLLRQHGPMVWAVCRHLLASTADAEDAFQATFLALVRSADRIRDGAAVGAWLHGVAVRAATKLKRSAVRRRKREEKVAGAETDTPVPDSGWGDLLAAVHEEVQRLPSGDRLAFVLCDLEGVRQPDAAARLGWKPGTLTGRLARARKALLERLTRRGIAPATAAGSLGIGTATAAAVVPPLLHERILTLIGTGANDVPPALLQLALEVTPMTLNRTKLLAAAVLLAGGLAVAVGTAGFPSADAQPPGNDPMGAGLPPPSGTGSPDGGPGAPPAGAPGGFPGAPGGSGGPDGLPPEFPGIGSADTGMGGMAAGPPHARWEYKFAGKPRTALEFGKLLADYGSEGWEFAGLVDYDASEQKNAMRSNPNRFSYMSGQSSSIVIFRRSAHAAAAGPGMPGPRGGRGDLGPGVGGSPSGSDGPGPGAGAGSGLPGSTPGRSGGLSRGSTLGRGNPPMGPGGMMMPGMSAGPQGPTTIKILSLKHAPVGRMAVTLQQVFAFGGSVHIVADEHTNSLIIRADEPTHAAVEALVQKLDVRPADSGSGGSGRPPKR